MPIPDHLTAVSWCDGDLAQISNITCEESIELYKENKIIANKQNPARSGTEQAADHQGSDIQVPLQNLPFVFQTLVNENRLQPGWVNHPHCSAFNVSAKNLQQPCPPTLGIRLCITPIVTDQHG